MNIYGTVLFLILAGGAGIFAILALTDTVEIMQVEGQIMEGTTWDEREGSRQECSKMGYYYDEYGDEYEECEQYRTVYFFVCSSNINFNYTSFEEPNGTLYESSDKITWVESYSSCLEDIQNSYPVGGKIIVYYPSEDIQKASLSEPIDPEGIYFCCAFCFAVLSVPALVIMLTSKSPGVSMKTGGMLKGLRPQRIDVSPPTGQAQYDTFVPGGSQGYPVPSQNAGAGRGGGGFGGGGMMVIPGMAGGAVGHSVGRQTQQRRGPSRKSKNNMSPSRISGYKRVIDTLNMSKNASNVYDAENMLRSSGFMNAADANKFMAHPFVMQSLGFAAGAAAVSGAKAATAASNSAGMLSRNVPAPSDANTNLRPAGSSEDRLQQMQDEAAAFFESAKPIQPKVATTTSRPVGEDESNQCAHPSCDTGVTSFDFRCFDCRRRFCSAHKGMTFQCSDCAS